MSVKKRAPARSLVEAEAGQHALDARLALEAALALEAVVHASRARLRAIILTSVTTVAGLAPLMLEQSFQAQFLIPMAISIAFGLVLATVLTLVLLPVFYMIFDDLKRIAMWAWNGPERKRESSREVVGVPTPDA